MDLRNETPYEADYFIGPGPGRQPCHVVIVKATFVLPDQPGHPAVPAEEQRPLVASDEYYRGDVTGSVYAETDLVSFKPRADVVVFGTAYAPGGRAVKALDASVQVGALHKTIRVIGDRRWLLPGRLTVVPVAGSPEPFTEMPLLDERAFGGCSPQGQAWCPENRIGRGIIGKKMRVEGVLLPNLEDPAHLIQSWKDEPRPTGFGWRRKDTAPRHTYLGSFEAPDQRDAVFALPPDFQHDFFNGAHPDLQVPGYLRGDEEVALTHLTPNGSIRFRLPGVQPRVTAQRAGVRNAGGDGMPIDTVLDTLVFLPDEGVFYQVWRGSFPVEEAGEDADIVVREDAGREAPSGPVLAGW